MEQGFAQMTLMEDEDEELELEINEDQNQTINYDLCLLGKFLTDCSIKFLAMKDRLASLWRPGRGVMISEPWPQLFIFQFYHPFDVKRVLDGDPWSCDNHLLLTHKLQEGEIPRSIILKHASFWVQIQDLSIGFMSENVGKQLGAFIGPYQEHDPNNNGSLWRTYMRIRVTIDVDKPLKRWKKIKRAGGDWCLVKFKYERLPIFCSICCLLGHGDRFCGKLFDHPELANQKEWGSWLRADPQRSNTEAGERWLREGGETVGNDGKREETAARFTS